MQHLVGAKLEILLSQQNVIIRHRKATFINKPTNRVGDFVINKTAIHVSTSPEPLLLQKCKTNLLSGYRPIIITRAKKILTAQVLAEDLQIHEQVEIFSAEGFLTTNLLIWSNFNTEKRVMTIEHLINRYNEIIEVCEADPSLKIEIKQF